VQTPHPPIWIGGNGPRRTLPLVGRFADAWHSWGTPGSLQESMTRIDELAVAAGRDPASILRASSLSLTRDFDLARKYIRKWRDGGWGYLVCGWPEEGADLVAEFATEVMPEFV
jgi:alkanesulfonate monooxygenase SsuD/methylene tetrahydromethanopterin reductase-like flavin-dependent oxidoreductase (luciferase family)